MSRDRAIEQTGTNRRQPVHVYGGSEHRQPGPFEECLLCKIEALEAQLAALKAINSWALRRCAA